MSAFLQHLGAGRQLLNAQNPAGALKHLHAALALSPDDAQALTLVSACRFDLNQLNEAKRFAEAALRVAPEFVAAHRVLGVIMARRRAAAAELARAAVIAAPRDPATQKFYAQVQMRRSTLFAPLWFAAIAMGRLSLTTRLLIWFALYAATFATFVAVPAPHHLIAGATMVVVTALYLLCLPAGGAVLNRMVARSSRQPVIRKEF